jgi:sugar/nucleoside kinase (ribokinase family)
MGRPDFLVIGHVAKDLTNGGYRLGGTALYSALTARNLGRSVGMITCASPDVHLSQLLEDVEVVCLPSPVTTTFRNVYQQGRRRQYVHAVADRIDAESVPSRWREAPVVHLGPIAGEFDADLMSVFPSSFVGLTPQGWLRQWDEQGRVSPCRWMESRDSLSRADAVIVSQEDLQGEAGTLHSQLGLSRLAVVTEGPKGATLHLHGKRYHYPAVESKAVDPTGAGDVFAAAFLVRLAETDDPHKAVRFATAAASISVTRVGIPSAPGRAEIEDVMRSVP